MNKLCSCGALIKEIPSNARLHCEGSEFDGYYFECEACKTTIFTKLENIEKKAA